MIGLSTGFIPRFTEDKERVTNGMNELIAELKKESLIVMLEAGKNLFVFFGKMFITERYDSVLGFSKTNIHFEEREFDGNWKMGMRTVFGKSAAQFR